MNNLKLGEGDKPTGTLLKKPVQVYIEVMHSQAYHEQEAEMSMFTLSAQKRTSILNHTLDSMHVIKLPHASSPYCLAFTFEIYRTALLVALLGILASP